jgi:hypothetical protein
MTHLGWAVYLGYSKEGEEVVKHFLTLPDVDISLEMKNGFFAGKTARQIAEYYKRTPLIKLLDQNEDSTSQKNQGNSSGMGSKHLSKSHIPRPDAEQERQTKQAILDYLDACEIPINDQVAICATLMKNGYSDLNKIVYADYKSLQRIGLKSSIVQAILAGKDILNKKVEEYQAPKSILKSKSAGEQPASILKRKSIVPPDTNKEKEVTLQIEGSDDVL